MSQLEVDKIIPQSGTTLTIGDSGDTVNFADGTSIGIDTNTLYIDSTNNRVGIGTTSPAEKLHVSSGGNADIQISPGANQCQILMTNAGATDYRMRSDNSPDGLIFGTSSIDAMTIDSSGNVGIGTTSPSAELHISKSADANATELILENTFTASSSTDEITQLQSRFGGYDASYIITGKEEDFTTSANRSSFMSFTTRKDGTLSEKLRIKGDGKVGIGTSSPNEMLQIHATGSSILQLTNNDTGTADNNGLYLGVISGGNAYIGLRDTNGSDLLFQTENTERMRIDSSGNLLVGKTSDAFAGEGLVFSPGSASSITRDDGNVISLRRDTSDGDIIKFYKDTTNVGNIFSRSGVVSGIILDPRAGGNGLLGQTGSIIPVDETQTREDNATDLGNSTYRFKDLYLGGGLYVGGTGTANKLDDYEEGTFTPTIIGTSSTGTFTPNGTYTRGRYTKVGRLVNIYFGLVYSSFTGTGNIKLGGLPFASEDTFMEVPPSIQGTGITKPSNSAIIGKFKRNSTEVEMLTYDTSSTVMSRTALAVDTAGEFYLSLTYHTA